mmetsp:Transcript_14397/g.35956  ORF Transcript_14397/g.35956 Transcript_14397/m.35956 type:complete len:267 (+) Transcript_14397:5155-5955(+)
MPQLPVRVVPAQEELPGFQHKGGMLAAAREQPAAVILCRELRGWVIYSTCRRSRSSVAVLPTPPGGPLVKQGRPSRGRAGQLHGHWCKRLFDSFVAVSELAALVATPGECGSTDPHRQRMMSSAGDAPNRQPIQPSLHAHRSGNRQWRAWFVLSLGTLHPHVHVVRTHVEIWRQRFIQHDAVRFARRQVPRRLPIRLHRCEHVPCRVVHAALPMYVAAEGVHFARLRQNQRVVLPARDLFRAERRVRDCECRGVHLVHEQVLSALG